MQDEIPQIPVQLDARRRPARPTQPAQRFLPEWEQNEHAFTDVREEQPVDRNEALREKGLFRFVRDEWVQHRTEREAQKEADSLITPREKKRREEEKKELERREKEFQDSLPNQRKHSEAQVPNHRIADTASGLLREVGNGAQRRGAGVIGGLVHSAGTWIQPAPTLAFSLVGCPENKGFFKKEPCKLDDFPVVVTAPGKPTPPEQKDMIQWTGSTSRHDREEVTPYERNCFNPAIPFERPLDIVGGLIPGGEDFDIQDNTHAYDSDLYGSAQIMIGSIRIRGQDDPTEQVVPCSFTYGGDVTAVAGHVQAFECNLRQVAFHQLNFQEGIYEWVRTSEGAIPQGRTPVLAGYDRWGHRLFHALKQIDGRFYHGSTAVHLKRANIYAHQQVRAVLNYDILCFALEKHEK